MRTRFCADASLWWRPWSNSKGEKQPSVSSKIIPLVSVTLMMNCNSDTQLPYRLPICEETHCNDLCKMQCVDKVSRKEIIEAAQISQDAQAGYACDYSNKRGPRAFNEVKECVKGHRTLAEQTADERRKRQEYIKKEKEAHIHWTVQWSQRTSKWWKDLNIQRIF